MNNYRITMNMSTDQTLPEFSDPLTFLRWLLSNESEKLITHLEMIRMSEWIKGWDDTRVGDDSRMSLNILLEALQSLPPQSKVIGFQGLEIENKYGTEGLGPLIGAKDVPEGEIGLYFRRVNDSGEAWVGLETRSE